MLLANQADKSLVRNCVASVMGRFLDFGFTPTIRPVDVYLNGEYIGVYNISEQIEVKKGRVELKQNDGDDAGFLIEIGGKDDDTPEDAWFSGTLSRNVVVKSPDEDEITPEQFAYIASFVKKADAAVKTRGNYEDYIDVDALIDWLILHELTCNLDSCFRRSCYMTKEPGGKLTMGPIWDFDLAFGNFVMDAGNYERWFSCDTKYNSLQGPGVLHAAGGAVGRDQGRAPARGTGGARRAGSAGRALRGV